MTGFDPEAIPEELRERDQWLLWDSSANTPRRPHWRGNTSISWNDPNDWHTFEQAVEAAEERDSWGIGYVFANTNDDHPRGLYGGLDLDGCADTDEGPKDWLPSMQPFFDHGAYMEKSPSGEGIHIPVAGFEPPDWWSNVFFSEEEHEGAEAYGSKFFTFTGDSLYSEEYENDAVVDHGEWVDEYLAELYEVITGEDPRAKPDPKPAAIDSEYQGDDWMDVDAAREALGHIDPDVGYETWRNIGFGLADEFPTGTADQLFTNWSRSGQMWDDEAERLADSIIHDSSPAGAGDPDISTVVWHAKEGGWEVPTGAPSTDGSEVVQSSSGSESEPETRELPTPGQFSLNNGGYGYWKQTDESEEWNEYTNFQLETNSFATDPDDPREKRIDMTVHPRHGEGYDVVVPPTVFNEARDFKSNVVTGLTTTFSGGTNVLNRLKTFVGTQDAPERIGTYQIGMHDGEWVTPDGVLTADGWEADPEHVHVARDIAAERKWALSPEDGAEYDDAVVREIAETLPETRQSERFLPAMGWFYAAPLKPLVKEWSGQFNLLSVIGETGSGKTATLSALWEAFGMEGDPMTADDTKFVLMTSLASSTSVPMWFDEYKPSDMRGYEVDQFWNEVRKTTRGGVSSRGNADGSTDEYHLDAPVVVSGEERVHGSAEERRGIFTTFRKAATDPGTDSARAFARLTGGSAKRGGSIEYYEGMDLSQHALAYYRFILAADPERLNRMWRNCAQEVSELLTEYDIEGLEDLVEQGLQTIVFGLRLYQWFGDHVGADVPVKDREIEDAVIYVATNVVGGANRKSHIDVFLEVMARAASHDYLEEGEHYVFVREGDSNEELRFSLSTTFDKVARYAREHDVAEDLLNSADDYRERIKDAEGSGYIATASQKSPPLARCVGIHLGRSEEQLTEFDKSMFTDTMDDSESIVATPISNLSSGYHDLTVECLVRETDTPDVIDETGVLKDATGVVDWIVWDRAESVDIEEEGTYLIQNAKVGHDPDGALQVELDGNVTEIREIGEGVGNLDYAKAGDNESIDAATDGGGEIIQKKPRLREIVREVGPCPKGRIIAEAEQRGFDMDTAKETLSELKKTGEVQELDGEWEVP